MRIYRTWRAFVVLSLVLTFRIGITKGDMLFVSQSRSVSASVSGGGSDSKSAPDFGPFNGSAAASYTNGDGTYSASADQNSILLPARIVASGNASCYNPFLTTEGVAGSSESTFEVVFDLADWAIVALTGEMSAYYDHGGTNGGDSAGSIELLDSGGQAIYLGNADRFNPLLDIQFDGVLGPGRYTLVISAVASIQTWGSPEDPGIGGGGSAGFSAIELTVNRVHIHNITQDTWHETVQQAIDAGISGDEIVLNPGTYTGDGNRDIDFAGKAITVRSSDPNDPDVVAATIIDCQGTLGNRHRGFIFHSGEGAGSVIDGLTITNGCAPDENIGGEVASAGGAIFCHGSSPTIRRCTVTGNLAAHGSIWPIGRPGRGGGIYCYSASPTITSCAITGNATGHASFDVHDAGPGGGICCDEGSSPVISNCLINQNYTGSGGDSSPGGPGGNGAGIYFGASSEAMITNSIIQDNHTGHGGSGTDFLEDGGDGGDGGGVYCDPFALPVIENCIISGNGTGNGGSGQGGVGYPTRGGDGGGGGGIYGSTVTIVNCTIVNNDTGSGGGVYYGTPGSHGQGGGLSVVGNTVISNTIIWSNSPNAVTGVNCDNVTYCDIGDGTCNGGEGNIAFDPRLTDDYHLQPWSLCIDAGNNSAVSPDVTTDLDGNPRIVNGVVDMGAYEAPERPPGLGIGAELLPPSVCVDGTNDGDSCARSDACPGGSCEPLLVFAGADPFETWQTRAAASCVGGDRNGLPCFGDSDCPGVGGTCDAAATSSIVPATGAFFYDRVNCVGGDPANGCLGGAWEGRLFANERPPNGFVEVQWYRAGSVKVGPPVKYFIEARAAENRWVTPARYFLNVPEADVSFQSPFTATPIPNAEVRGEVLNASGTLFRQADVIPENGGVTVNLTCPPVGEECPSHRSVIMYTGGAASELKGFEVVEFLRQDDTVVSDVDIGRRIPLPDGADNCRAAIITNSQENNFTVAWPTKVGAIDHAKVFPIRRDRTSDNLKIAWYTRSLVGLPGEEFDLGNCWPWAVRQYTTEWPKDDLQTHVIDAVCLGGSNAGVQCGGSGDCPLGACEPSAGSVIDLTGAGRYCAQELQFQTGFLSGDLPPNAFPSDVVAGQFKARRPGYSVIRFDRKPDDLATCGDEVAFEVIASYDHHASMVFQEQISSPIGTWIWGPDEQAWHDPCHPNYRYGYIRSGLPYAPRIYHPQYPAGVDSDDYTGQIIPVNSSDVHGPLEVWWYEGSLASSVVCTTDADCDGPCIEGVCRDTAGNHAQNLFWPHKVKRYEAVWPQTDSIVIASRAGVGPTGVNPLDQGYSDAWKVYGKEDWTVEGDDSPTLPGWNPNDEHAEFIEVIPNTLRRLFAVRDDNPRQIHPLTGHPYVLAMSQSDVGEDACGTDVNLWTFNVHKVEPTDATYDFHYDTRLFFVDDTITERPAIAGRKLKPVLFPVNFLSAGVCDDDDTGDILNFAVGDGAWVDRAGDVWAVESYHDGLGEAIAEGQPSIPDIYHWEIWSQEGEPGCQPWRGYVCVGGSNDDLPCELAQDCPGGRCDPAEPFPVTYEFTWPVVEGDGVCFDGSDDGATCTSSTDCDVQCSCSWPADPGCARRVRIGETDRLFDSCGPIEVLHDSVGIKIIDPHRIVCSPLDATVGDLIEATFASLPPHLFNGQVGGQGELTVDRIGYDSVNQQLCLTGIMSDRDREFLEDLNREIGRGNCDNVVCDAGPRPTDEYCCALRELQDASRINLDPSDRLCNLGANDGDPCGTDVDCPDGECLQATLSNKKHISISDINAKPGWLTIGKANADFCKNRGASVKVDIWQVSCPPDLGEVIVREPQCPFSNSITIQHIVDGGGVPENLIYQWQFSIVDPESFEFISTDWQDCNLDQCASGRGLREIVLSGGSLLTLQDTWWHSRYRGICGCACAGGECTPPDWPYDDNSASNGMCDGIDGTTISGWTDHRLAEGWVKRVVRGLNVFDQRIKNFRDNEITTYVSMISQAGTRFENPIPLSCDADTINNLGLIEAYSMVLLKAREIIREAGLTTDGANLAILLAASKVSDLYTLLGHEAFADATDPTVALFIDRNADPTNYDPATIWAFGGLVNDLLEEELVLLRGRDRCQDIEVPGAASNATVYNRLTFNVTTGLAGEVAYANNYQVLSQAEAAAAYPQGHGDAWGHYVTAIKQLYTLLRDPLFEWVVSAESLTIDDNPVRVGFEHERRFARIAAAKARTGAAVTNLTFRRHYTADPSTQDGYPDTDDASRRWGVNEWARRTGHGAYFDWVMANTLLDNEDTEHPDGSIEKIDRTTVPEIREIASAYTEIQSTMDKVNAGLNPLGLAANVVPFGLDPSASSSHFEQILDRAVDAVNNAITVFNYANQNTQRLRSIQDDEDKLEQLVEERELDFTGRLIEIFGTPYPDDVGPGKTFSDADCRDNYGNVTRCPDTKHFDYFEPSDLLGEINASNTTTFTVEFADPHVDQDGAGAVSIELHSVEYTVSTDGLGLVKPPHWTGQRVEPGEIQVARSEVLQAMIRYRQGVDRYEAHLDQIERQADQIQSQYAVNARVLEVQLGGVYRTRQLNQLISDARSQQLRFRRYAGDAVMLANAIAESLPQVMIFGFSNGADFTAGIRSAIRQAGTIAARILNEKADNASLTELQRQQDKELASLAQNIKIQRLNFNQQLNQQVDQLEQLLRGTSSLRLDIYMLEEALNQAIGRYHTALGRGGRLLDQREAFLQRTARDVSKLRYRDLAHRIFRNDALGKYRAQFDLAAQYVFLAARAYDYETNLPSNDTDNANQFLEDAVEARSLGLIQNGSPLRNSAGLAGVLAELSHDWELFKVNHGWPGTAFNEAFDLRWQQFRIPNSSGFNEQWREKLRSFIVEDMTQLAEYQQYATSYCGTPPCTPVRALVIPFSTTITSGFNFFGKNLSSGDVDFPEDQLIKLQTVGVRFKTYPAQLSLTPEVYLLPVGVDVMRSPERGGEIREWHILDQTLPAVDEVFESQLIFNSLNNWVPTDALDGGAPALVVRRRFPQIQARDTSVPDTQLLSPALTGRSVWNTKWVLIIRETSLLNDPAVGNGLDIFIDGSTGNNGVRDIRLLFNTRGFQSTVLLDRDGGNERIQDNQK